MIFTIATIRAARRSPADYSVHLNGKHVPNVIYADTDAGVVRAIELEPSNGGWDDMREKHDEYGKPVEYEAHGRVEVYWRDELVTH